MTDDEIKSGIDPVVVGYTLARLTGCQRYVLDKIGDGQHFVWGSELRVARRLENVGFVAITDNGEMIIDGRTDGERWSVELTAKGYAAVQTIRRCTHLASGDERGPFWGPFRCPRCGRYYTDQEATDVEQE